MERGIFCSVENAIFQRSKKIKTAADPFTDAYFLKYILIR